MYVGACCPRVVREVSIQLNHELYIAHCSFRCLAPGDDLDRPDVLPRRKLHTQTLVEEFEILECWDNWGIIADIIVCIPSFSLILSHPILAPFGLAGTALLPLFIESID